MKKLIKTMGTSKKFWYSIAGVAVIILSESMGLDEKASQNIVYTVMALVLGQGVADFGKHQEKK
tara:strand:+ start:12703 stop:12894 length:192 start_codon:yes stop_codon:yes gene_type:complete